MEGYVQQYGATIPIAYNLAGDNWRPPGVKTVGCHHSGTPAAGTANAISPNLLTPVVEDNFYILSVYTASHRSLRTDVRMVFYNDAIQPIYVAITSVPYTGQNGGKDLNNWVRAFVRYKAPSGARYVDVEFWAVANGIEPQPYWWWCKPMLEQVPESQEEPSPWSAGGQEQAASHTVTLDVGGNISGTQSMNDGKRSTFSILANIFRVISSASSGLEWQNGYLRAYSAGIQLVLGINFGAASNLCFWYGPNVGVGNCNKSNGTIWFDNTGGAYFGGSLSAGVKKNAVQTTTTVTVGTELVNGPFDTNGTVRQVTISFGRSTNYVSNDFGAGGFVAGAGANSASVAVYRKIGTAAETLWQTMPVGGGINIFNEGDAPDRATAYWSGSMTINDTSPAASTVTYRAVITAFASQDISHPGTINSITTTQNLSIISVEN